MKRSVNGEQVEISQKEAYEIQAEWDINADLQVQKEIDDAREQKKGLLKQQKLESMLTVEFAEIDAAATKADIEKVKLK